MVGSVGRAQIMNILDNITLAQDRSKPMCQDTGIIAFLINVGDGFPIRSKVKEMLIKATRRSTEIVPLRPNAVDIFKGNTGDNVGLNGHVPIIYIDLVPGEDLEIIVMPKGGGSTNVAAYRMLKPSQGWRGIKQFVIEALAEAGSLACPPYFVGVGIGGGEDLCMTLAKKALLKPFKSRNENPDVSAIEYELLEKVNQLGIGVMGLGEGPTALDLHIEIAARHPASLPVGLVISCWALRHSRALISAQGKVHIDKIA